MYVSKTWARTIPIQWMCKVMKFFLKMGEVSLKYTHRTLYNVPGAGGSATPRQTVVASLAGSW